MRRLLLIALGLAACQASPETANVEQDLVGNATILLSSGTSTFNSTQVGSTSNTLYFGVRTTANNSSITITNISYSCTDYTITAVLPGYADRTCETSCFVMCPQGQICSNDDYSFSAVFHPSVAAATNCVVTAVTTAGNVSVTLGGTGTPPPIHVSAAPGNINYGGVRINTDSTGVGVSVVNTGGSTATINYVSASAGFGIVAGNTGAHALGADASEGFTVICHPSSLGAIAGSLNVSSNDPSTPSIAIPLACSGIDSALAVSPSPAVLPTLRVGESEQQTITVTNMGAAPTSIQNVTVTGMMTMVSAPPPGTALAANGGSASVTVSFDAQIKGDVTGTLHVDYDNGKTIDTQISGKAVATSLSLTPDGNVELGPICVGQSKSQDFSLLATDEGAFALTSVSALDAPFTLTTPTLPAHVQGLAANTVKFTVDGAPTASGDITASLVLGTDIPMGDPHTVNLHMLGLDAGVNGPPQVDLGGNLVNQTSLGQHVEITNCTDAPVTISSVNIDGTDAADFAVVDQPEELTIMPTLSIKWLVILDPHSTGEKSATFNAVSDAGAITTVPLIGEGLGSAGDTGGASSIGTKSSYYACSTGRASSLWPIGFALGALLLRRRRLTSTTPS